MNSDKAVSQASQELFFLLPYPAFPFFQKFLVLQWEAGRQDVFYRVAKDVRTDGSGFNGGQRARNPSEFRTRNLSLALLALTIF